MADTYTAQMSGHDGWHLYIALFASLSGRWPECKWEQSAPVPTVAERATVLAKLGYEIVPGTEWEWCESSDDPDDPTSAVHLIAAVTVRRVSGVTG